MHLFVTSCVQCVYRAHARGRTFSYLHECNCTCVFSSSVCRRNRVLYPGTLWSRLDAAAVLKQAYLDDALARTTLKKKVLLLANQHLEQYDRISKWADQKAAYLSTVEDIGDVASALVQLRLLEAFVTEKSNTTTTTVSTLRELGLEVLNTKYVKSNAIRCLPFLPLPPARP